MKHKKKLNNFGSSKSQRNATLVNMAIELLTNEYMTTTKAKARATKSYVDQLIARSTDSLAGRRRLKSKLKHGPTIEKIFDTYKKRYTDVSSGFVESYKVGYRKGDGADMIKLMMKGYAPKTKSKLTKVKNVKTDDTDKNKKETKPKKRSVFGGNRDAKKSQVASTTDKSKAKSRSGI